MTSWEGVPGLPVPGISAGCVSMVADVIDTASVASPRQLIMRRRNGPGGNVAPAPFARLFGIAGRRAVKSIAPRRTFDDVILPPATRRALDIALSQVTQHDLIFNRWGFAERHPTGLALAFEFRWPAEFAPKTICAEAIAHSLGRRLLLPCQLRGARVGSGWVRRRKMWRQSSGPPARKAPCCSSTRRTRFPAR